MKDLVFITGNQYKADYLAKWLGHPVKHHKLDLDELQTLDVHEIVAHKASQAYKLLQQPVLVEDTTLTFHVLGRLPGTLIKWFLQELGPAGLCRLLDNLDDRRATATATFGLYDGKQLRLFEGMAKGEIAKRPRGEGFGWNPIFIPENHSKTFAEMTDEEMQPLNHRGRALQKLHDFLTKNS